MKKVFSVASACCLMAVSAALMSCNPDGTKCWKMQATYPSGQTEEWYFYGSGDEADAQLELKHQAGANKIHREASGKSKSDCTNN